MCKLTCYNCKYKINIPGDAHISCKYPLLKESDATVISMASIANPKGFNKIIEQSFGFTANSFGLQSGYFMFPNNYDPSWMQGECNKHSELVGEAVEYQLTLDRYLEPYKQLMIALDKGSKNKDIYQPVLDAYEYAIDQIKALGTNLTEEKQAEGRVILVQELEKAFVIYNNVEESLKIKE